MQALWRTLKLGLYCLLLIANLWLAGCASNDSFDSAKSKSDEYVNVPPQRLFIMARTALKRRNYSRAVEYLESLQTHHPFNTYSEKAQLELIYAYYKAYNNIAAAVAAARFIKLYPRSSHVDYAYYMQGLANFQQERGVFAEFLPLNVAWRDPGTQSQAYIDFSNLLRLYPHSKYAPDARQRLVYLRNLLAKKELYIASYYLRRNMYVAAMNRAMFLVRNYPQAPQVPQALAILKVCNQYLNLQHSELDNIISFNYPKFNYKA